MNNAKHEWCSDTARDEAVRAAEDAAAVPSIQHRDLPEQVALVWASLGDLIGRVVRLEGEMDAGQDEEASPAVCDSASPAEGLRTERVTLEITHGINSRPVELATWVRSAVSWKLHTGESVRVVEETTIGSGDVFRDVGCGSTGDEIARLTAERDAAREECERLRACADPFGEELAVIAAWERCAITADWPADEPETAVRCAASMEREILRLRARVAELEAAPPPRGWMTAEEREAVDAAADAIGDRIDAYKEQDGDRRRIEVLDALLARSSPPRVRRPPRACTPHRDAEWIAAIRAAGGEVGG